MRLVLRRAAKRDLLEASRWYDERQPGLGSAFLAAVEATLSNLLDHPEAYPRIRTNPRLRRATPRRFPYGIFYTVSRDRIDVVAILHHARSPEIWGRRS